MTKDVVYRYRVVKNGQEFVLQMCGVGKTHDTPWENVSIHYTSEAAISAAYKMMGQFEVIWESEE